MTRIGAATMSGGVVHGYDAVSRWRSVTVCLRLPSIVVSIGALMVSLLLLFVYDADVEKDLAMNRG